MIMSDENLNTEGPTEGVSAPAGGVDPARDAAREAQGETPAPAAPAGETPAETTGDDVPEATEQPEPTETPETPADESPAGEEMAQ